MDSIEFQWDVPDRRVGYLSIYFCYEFVDFSDARKHRGGAGSSAYRTRHARTNPPLPLLVEAKAGFQPERLGHYSLRSLLLAIFR